MKTCVAALLLLIAVPSVAKKEDPYVWPALPGPESIQKGMRETTYTGLVVLEKRCSLDVGSFQVTPSGVKRDMFVRYLVVNDEGVQKASISISGEEGAKIERIEARTMSPDGTVTPADSKKDIHTTEVKKFDRSKVLASLAEVNFPAPVKGAILDIHVITSSDNTVIYAQEALTYEGTPSLKTFYDITIRGGLPGYSWSVLLVNDPEGGGHLRSTSTGKMELDLGRVAAKRVEPHSLPGLRTQVVLVIYIDLTPADRKKSRPKGGSSSSYSADPKGRITDLDWESTPYKDSWVDFAKDDDKSSKEFIKKAGTAEEIQVDVLAPKDKPMEERVRALFRHAQEHCGYNPDAEGVDTLSAMMKKGETAHWQGTLFLSYLLQRAGIPHRRVQVLNRYNISFSPIITNIYLYRFSDAIMVDLPAGATFLQPGDPTLPFGCLSDANQYSLAFGLEGDKTIQTFFTPFNPPGLDQVEYRYEAQISADGNLTGSMTFAERGAPGREFRGWNLYREFRKSHPNKDKDKKKTAQDWAKELDENLRDEVEQLGTRVTFDKHALAKVPKESDQFLEITCALQGSGLAQAAQDKWLVCACPLLAGFASPFTDPHRDTAIWNDDGGKVVFDGTVKLPAGTQVVELPTPVEFEGPDRAKITLKVERGEKDGVPSLHSRLEFDWPLIVGSDAYPSWQTYLAKLASLAESRCVVTLPQRGELE